MKRVTRSLDQIDIIEAVEFRRAGIQLLDEALSRLRRRRLRIALLPEGRGLARALNLVHWRPDANREWLDGDAVHADQVVHFAIHAAMDETLGSAHPHAALYAECAASAVDVFLAGKLARAGEETEFLGETLESWAFYYERYAAGEADFATLLEHMREQPGRTATALTEYLFRFTESLTYPDDDDAALDALAPLTEDFRYPLVHHYHVSNWALHIRARFPTPPQKPADLAPGQALFAALLG